MFKLHVGSSCNLLINNEYTLVLVRTDLTPRLDSCVLRPMVLESEIDKILWVIEQTWLIEEEDFGRFWIFKVKEYGVLLHRNL